MRIDGKLPAAAVCLTVALAMAGTRAAAQSGCLRGNVAMALGVNGTITVCPEYDKKVPELQKQLNEIQKTLNGNQALLRDVTHSARSINTLGRDVDTNRQVELLRSFSKELQAASAQDQQNTQKQIGELADKLDKIQDLITQKTEDDKTAQQTKAALNGQLGDAIAALDLVKAQQQLDSIQAKLDKIGEDTHEIRQTLEQQAAREKAAEEKQKKDAEDLDNDPNMYTRAQIMSQGNSRYMVFFYTRPPLYPPFVDSSFS